MPNNSPFTPGARAVINRPRCEACGTKRKANQHRWYVDPEGVELCPSCADDLHATWMLEGFAEPLAPSRRDQGGHGG